jgi:hypothetical protein
LKVGKSDHGTNRRQRLRPLDEEDLLVTVEPTVGRVAAVDRDVHQRRRPRRVPKPDIAVAARGVTIKSHYARARAGSAFARHLAQVNHRVATAEVAALQLRPTIVHELTAGR